MSVDTMFMGTLSKYHTENAINVTRGKNDDLFDDCEPQKPYTILVTSANLHVYGPDMGLMAPLPFWVFPLQSICIGS